MTPSPGRPASGRRPLPINKNLRAISLSLVAKVRARPVVTSTEIANELAREAMAEIASDVSPAELAAVEKNIRRRLYDSLKVLVSVGAITRGRASKTLRWNGVSHLARPLRRGVRPETVSLGGENLPPDCSSSLAHVVKEPEETKNEKRLSDALVLNSSVHIPPRNGPDMTAPGDGLKRTPVEDAAIKKGHDDVCLSDCDCSSDSSIAQELLNAAGAISAAKKRINAKTAALRALGAQQQALKNLCERNIRLGDSHASGGKISLPFVLVRTPDDTDITLEATEDARRISFNFSDYFQVVNDSGVIERLFRADAEKMSCIKSSPCRKRRVGRCEDGRTKFFSLSTPEEDHVEHLDSSLRISHGRRSVHSHFAYPIVQTSGEVGMFRTPPRRRRFRIDVSNNGSVSRRLFLAGNETRCVKDSSWSPIPAHSLSPPHAQALSHSGGSGVTSRRAFAPIPAPHCQSFEDDVALTCPQGDENCVLPTTDNNEIDFENFDAEQQASCIPFGFYDCSGPSDSAYATNAGEYLDMKF